MRSDNAIEIINVSKKFQTHHIFKGDKKSIDNKTFQVLSNVNLNIKEGSITGIVGKNGIGKSTLLKIISGIIKPNTGKILVRGNIASILELGTGFINDISGLENIKYYFQLLGYGSLYNNIIAQEIIKFSELNEYINEPIKHYSSGMHMRLAFSIVIHLPADIFLLDEVFSVGDQSFRVKCMKKIQELSRLGKTFLIVTHDLFQVRTFCNQILLINKDNIELSNQVNTIVDQYIQSTHANDVCQNQKNEESLWQNDSHNPFISSIKITGNKNLSEYDSSDDIILDFEIHKKNTLPIDLTFVFNFSMEFGFLGISPNSFTKDNLEAEGIRQFKCQFPANFFNEGSFFINAFINDRSTFKNYKIENIAFIQITNNSFNKGQITSYSGPIFLKDVWK